jgi:hypothetical protein
MKETFYGAIGLLLIIGYYSCESHQSAPKTSAQAQKESLSEIPEIRKKINDTPVAEFREKTGDALNDWYFLVQVYETRETFQYQVKLQFEEIRAEDTIRFPNFGIWPKPRIQKGKDKFSCIIGFLDQENKFREYKLVSVKDSRELKISTLARYAVVPMPEK